MKLVDKYMQDGTELNISGNGGTHYNGVRIVEVYDDFIIVEAGETAMRTAGQFRGGRTNINICTITRLEEAELASRIRGDVMRR
jgi:hypothetical protein